MTKLAVERNGGFLHLLDQDAVGMIRAFECVNLRALGSVNHHRVDFAGVDGADGRLGLFQAGHQIRFARLFVRSGRARFERRRFRGG